MDFTERLKIIIEFSGLKRDEFAQQCGISRAQLFKYLKGDQEPGTGFYRALKQNMPGIDVGWLIAGIGNMLSIHNGEKDLQNSEVISYQDALENEHFKLIKQFRDKETALNANKDLLDIEKNSNEAFVKAVGYLKGVRDAVSPSASYEKKGTSHTTWKGTDRRKNRAG